MDEESNAVLRMVAEKKITAEEGERLLQVLESTREPSRTPRIPSRSSGVLRMDPRVEEGMRLAEEEIRSTEEEIRSAEEEIRSAERELRAVGMHDEIGAKVQEKIREKMERVRQRMEERRLRWEQRREEWRKRHEERQRRFEGRGRRHAGVHIPPIPPIPPIPDIGKIVSEAVGSAMAGVGKGLDETMKGVFVGKLSRESQAIQVGEGIERIAVECSGGDVALSLSTGTSMTIEGHATVSTESGEIAVNSRDDVTLSVPSSVKRLHLVANGGDIDCRLGPLEGHTIVLKANGGDIQAATAGLSASRLELEAHGGDIDLAVPDDAAFAVVMKVDGGGDIETHIPLEAEEQTSSFFKGRRNGGGDSLLALSSHGGSDIRLRVGNKS